MPLIGRPAPSGHPDLRRVRAPRVTKSSLWTIVFNPCPPLCPQPVDYVFDPTFCSVDAAFLLELVVIGEVAQSLLGPALDFVRFAHGVSLNGSHRRALALALSRPFTYRQQEHPPGTACWPPAHPPRHPGRRRGAQTARRQRQGNCVHRHTSPRSASPARSLCHRLGGALRGGGRQPQATPEAARDVGPVAGGHRGDPVSTRVSEAGR